LLLVAPLFVFLIFKLASFIVPGYDKAGFDDSSWNAALVTTGPAGVLVNARQPPTKIIGSMAPVSIKAVQGSYVVAFPRVVAGWAKITVTGPAKTLITVHFGEKLNSDGTVQYQGQLLNRPYIYIRSPFTLRYATLLLEQLPD
jgi:hypothetical protein